MLDGLVYLTRDECDYIIHSLCGASSQSYTTLSSVSASNFPCVRLSAVVNTTSHQDILPKQSAQASTRQGGIAQLGEQQTEASRLCGLISEGPVFDPRCPHFIVIVIVFVHSFVDFRNCKLIFHSSDSACSLSTRKF